jgi:hypothetical protein
MGLSCFFGHKWAGLRCERCGETRKAIEVLCKSPLYKCEVCKTTGQRLKEIEKAKADKIKQLIPNVGVYLDMDLRVMLFCKKCSSFICSTCALAGDEMKRCPSCRAYFDFDSIAEDTKDPLAVLALVAQKGNK